MLTFLLAVALLSPPSAAPLQARTVAPAPGVAAGAVSLTQQAVALDLFPTFLSVSGTVGLKAGSADVKGLEIGFEKAPELAALREVAVFVNGQPTPTKDKTFSGKVWRVWTVDIPAGETIEVNSRFTLIPPPHAPVIPLRYVVSAAGFATPSGAARVQLNRHGVASDALTFPALAPVKTLPATWLFDAVAEDQMIEASFKPAPVTLEEALQTEPDYISSRPVTPLHSWVDGMMRLMRAPVATRKDPKWVSRFYDHVASGQASESHLARAESELLLTHIKAAAPSLPSEADDTAWCAESLFKADRPQLDWPPLIQRVDGDLPAADALLSACVARVDRNRTRFWGMVAGFGVLLSVLVLLGLKRRRG